MGLYQNFPYTNLHELNLDWLIEQLNKISSSSVLSVNGQTGQVILYENATVQFPNVPEDAWTIIRMADGTTRGIYFGSDDKAYIIHGANLEAVYSSNNQPPYPVTRVNGQTGDITLYQDQYIQLPSLSDLNMHNWTLFRNLNSVSEGIQFGEDGSAYIIHGTSRYLIYTTHDSPQGVVESVNGQSGTVILFTDSQGDITFPNYSNEDVAGWILKRSINGIQLGIMFNDDGTVDFKCGGALYKIYTSNDPQEGYVSNPTDSMQEVEEDSTDDYWGLLRTTSEGKVGIIFENTDPDNPTVSLAYVDSNDQEQQVQLVTFDDIPSSSVISVNNKSGIITLYGTDIEMSNTDSRTIPDAVEDVKELTAFVENSNIAVNNINQGQFVVWNNGLYKAGQNIASGDSLSLSNLTAVTRGGFNELYNDVYNLVNRFTNLIKFKTYSYNYTVSANSTKDISVSDFGITQVVVDGMSYVPVAVLRAYTGHGDIAMCGYNPYYGSGTVMKIRNLTGSSVSGTAYIEYAWIRSGYTETL